MPAAPGGAGGGTVGGDDTSDGEGPENLLDCTPVGPGTGGCRHVPLLGDPSVSTETRNMSENNHSVFYRDPCCNTRVGVCLCVCVCVCVSVHVSVGSGELLV